MTSGRGDVALFLVPATAPASSCFIAYRSWQDQTADGLPERSFRANREKDQGLKAPRRGALGTRSHLSGRLLSPVMAHANDPIEPRLPEHPWALPRDARPSLQDGSGSRPSEIGSLTSGTGSQTTANRWQTNQGNARARLSSVNVSDGSAPKTGWSASKPVSRAKRRTPRCDGRKRMSWRRRPILDPDPTLA